MGVRRGSEKMSLRPVPGYGGKGNYSEMGTVSGLSVPGRVYGGGGASERNMIIVDCK